MLLECRVQPTEELYSEALDYLNRLRAENKINDTTLELFTLLYGDDMIHRLKNQGFFNTNLN